MFVRSKNRFSDSLTIGTGLVKKKIVVELDLLHSAQQIIKAREMVAEAQKEALEAPSASAIEKYGLALRSLVSSVFGEKQADELITFYEGQYDSMLNDVMPFVFKRVIPAINRASKARARAYQRKKK